MKHASRRIHGICRFLCTFSEGGLSSLLITNIVPPSKIILVLGTLTEGKGPRRYQEKNKYTLFIKYYKNVVPFPFILDNKIFSSAKLGWVSSQRPGLCFDCM